ncbi:hypothetical protein [Entomohabitans teleogrylli]|uniref:phage tail tube protein n=1 Tax=Entomohabitans teleogrylli TaxID=1384589 RepID=UPI00073D92E2|nr:hypothetical protein [Entomohabitans teleogrylli]
MDKPYYYGQGKVYLSLRSEKDIALDWKWIGDVSELAVTLNFDEQKTKISRGGVLYTGEKIKTGHNGTVSAKWFNFSDDNLSTLLDSNLSTQLPDIVSNYTFPSGITAGCRVCLPHQRVWSVDIPGMTQDTDYIVDRHWGAIVFNRTPTLQPLKVSYEHARKTVIPLAMNNKKEFSLRYEGINLAEKNSYVLLELYRIAYEPISGWSLINDGSTLNNIETKAELLIDPRKFHDPFFGPFGQVSMFEGLSGITHNGSIQYDGKYTHRG